MVSEGVVKTVIMYNDQRYKNRRRELRKNQTEAERFLWRHLRNGRFFGLKFFRQYGVGHYILDFYCPQHRLAIELDGSQHLETAAAERDIERTQYLNGQDITVLRFWNNDVSKDIDGVLEKIRLLLEESPSL